MGKGSFMKVCIFSSNEFWKNIGCIVSAPTFGLGGLDLWEKQKVKIKKEIKGREIPFMKGFICMRFVSNILYFIYWILYYITSILLV